MARRLHVRMGHVHRSAGEFGEVLLPHRGGCLCIQAAVQSCAGKASCRRRQLTGSGRIRSSCRRASASAAATKSFTSSAQVCRSVVGAMPFSMANGSMCTASPSQRTLRGSSSTSAVRCLIHRNEGKEAIGRDGRGANDPHGPRKFHPRSGPILRLGCRLSSTSSGAASAAPLCFARARPCSHWLRYAVAFRPAN